MSLRIGSSNSQHLSLEQIGSEIVDVSKIIGRLEGFRNTFPTAPFARQIDDGILELESIPPASVELIRKYRDHLWKLASRVDCIEDSLDHLSNPEIASIYRRQIDPLKASGMALSRDFMFLSHHLHTHEWIQKAFNKLVPVHSAASKFSEGSLEPADREAVKDKLISLRVKNHLKRLLRAPKGDEASSKQKESFETIDGLIADFYSEMKLDEITTPKETRKRIKHILEMLGQFEDYCHIAPSAVPATLMKQFHMLPEALKNKVYGYVYELSPQPKGGPRWGELNLLKDYSIASDAIIKAVDSFPEWSPFPPSLPTIVIESETALPPLPTPSVGEMVQAYSENPPAASLNQLKVFLNSLCKSTKYDDADKEKIAQAMIEASEKKGLVLDGPKGVYYYVWEIAHETDKKAGGHNWGRINAPKNLPRLVQAFERMRDHMQPNSDAFFGRD